MRFLICGDPHFSTSNHVESLQLIEDFMNYIDEYSPDVVVILGDMLHKHDKIDMSPFKRMVDFLSRIHERGIILICLIGNHDRRSNDVCMTDEHAFNGLKKWKNTYIVDKAMSLSLNSLNILLMPYVPDNTFFDCIEKENIDIYSHDIVFSHQLFNYCDVAHLITSNGGYIEEYPKDAPLNISGHIHEYQDLDNLIYAGTPFQQTFAESIDKAIMLLDMDNKEHYKIKRLRLNIETKQTIEVDVDDLHNLIIPDGIIRLKIKGSSEVARRIMIEKMKTVKDKKRIKVQYIDDTKRKIDKVIVSMTFKERMLKEAARFNLSNELKDICLN